MDSLSITDLILQVNRTFACELDASDIHEGNLQCVLDHLVKSGHAGQKCASSDIPPPPTPHVQRRQEEVLPAYDYYLTRSFVRKTDRKNRILTSHVGSLPPTFGSDSFGQIYLGLDTINDGEIRRGSYVDEVLHRIVGFSLE